MAEKAHGAISDMDCEEEHSTEFNAGAGEEGLDKTQAPSDVEAALDEDVTSVRRLEGFDSEKKEVYGGVKGLISIDRSMGSDALANWESCSGSAKKSFSSVCTASMWSSSLGTFRSVNFQKRVICQNPNSSVVQEAVKKDDLSLLDLAPGVDVVKNKKISTFLTTLTATKVHKHNYLQKNEYRDSVMQRLSGDEANNRIRKPRVRKLGFENTPAEENEASRSVSSCTKALTGKNETTKKFELEKIGVSLEESQENVLEYVDKLVSLYCVDWSGELNIQNPHGETSPPGPLANGTQSFAKKICLRGSVKKAQAFDWIDSAEDESGGAFFSRRKDILFEDRQYLKLKHQTSTVNETPINKSRTKNKITRAEMPQKSVGFVPPESISRLRSLGASERVQSSVFRPSYFLHTGYNEDSDEESYKLQQGPMQDTCGLQDLKKIGNSTLFSVEGLEAAKCGPPAIHDTINALPATKTATECSDRGIVLKKGHLKDNSTKKRDDPTSGYHITSRQTRSMTKNLMERNFCDKKIAKDFNGTVVPIAHRTRQSVKASLRRIKMPGDGLANCSIDNDTLKNKRKRLNSVANLAETPTIEDVSPESGSHKIWKTGQNKEQIEELILEEVLHKRNGHINHRRKDASSSHEGWRTFKGILDHVTKANSHTSSKKKCLKGNVKSTSLNFNTFRRTTRSTSKTKFPLCMSGPSSLSPSKTGQVDNLGGEQCKPSNNDTASCSGKVPVGTSIKTRSSRTPDITCSLTNSIEGPIKNKRFKFGSFDANVNFSNEVTRGKTPSDDPRTLISHASAVSEPKDAIDFPTATVTESPKEKGPFRETFNLSPVCIGDDPHNQAGRRSLSRPFLMKELLGLYPTEATRTPALRNTQQRRDMEGVRVFFSHNLCEEIIKQQRQILARLGSSVASTLSNATHFVADKFLRSRNMLEAIAKGMPVVTHFWIESCGQANCLIDEKNYILRDFEKEKEIGFSMPLSLAHARQSPLLQGKRVCITHNVKPDQEVIASLVKAVHGKGIMRAGRSMLKNCKIPDDLLIISCEKDYYVCTPFLDKGAEIYSSELLLNGVVTQKLEFARYRLFIDHVKKRKRS